MQGISNWRLVVTDQTVLTGSHRPKVDSENVMVDLRLWWFNFDVYNYLNVLYALVFIYTCICTRDERMSEDVRGMRGKKWGIYCSMLPGLCHVGCARMAGQKNLIKIFFLVLERRGTGFCPDLLSVCVASFLFFMLFPCSCVQQFLHRSSGYLFFMDK